MKNKEFVQLLQTSAELVVGNGSKIRFWHEVWMKVGVLKHKFPKLFLLSNEKNAAIQECGGMEWVYLGLELDLEKNSMELGGGAAPIFRGKSEERLVIVNEAVQLVDKWKMELVQRRNVMKHRDA
ncbi:hypothetical protein PIB30_017212 [Stylosanthes scabra]|uniref:Uncharacterized protein n=1 Tax=Stylosanthes scabra TaxID=79078 RepID=A0ABU6Y7Y9_9FABA|nr:hypothetical protein [Stylosanthes scabra]